MFSGCRCFPSLLTITFKVWLLLVSFLPLQFGTCRESCETSKRTNLSLWQHRCFVLRWKTEISLKNSNVILDRFFFFLLFFFAFQNLTTVKTILGRNLGKNWVKENKLRKKSTAFEQQSVMKRKQAHLSRPKNKG